MSYNTTLRAAIAAAVKTPADPRVTGAMLQQQLLSVIDALDTGAKYMGTASPASVPTTEANCFFVATQEGSYTNFVDTGGQPLVVGQGEVALIRSVIHQGILRWQKTTLFAAGQAQTAVSITYAALKQLRDGNNLVPGTWYRITDYACTTTQANTQSANHAFDIIVRADDASHLNENAYAAHHDGDTYFQDCKLEAWELKYSLDNDTDRFAWADEDNGKGVVYWMKDEWDNECPYDFKNIQFVRKLGSSGQYSATGTEKWVYTFNAYANSKCNDNTVLACSVETFSCYNNTIKECFNPTTGVSDKLTLNDIVFLDYGSGSCYGNYFGAASHHNTLGRRCQKNTFEGQAYNNVIGNLFVNNHIGQEFNENTMGTCQHNVIGNSVDHCSIVGLIDSTIGSIVDRVTTGSDIYDLTIGNNCGRIVLESHYFHVHVYGSVKNVLIKGGESNNKVGNVYVIGKMEGVSNEEPLTIEFAKGETNHQIACLDSEGNLQIFNPADLLG